MKKFTLSIVTIFIMFGCFFATNVFAVTNVGVSYRSHIQNIGWQAPVIGPALSGTSGQGLRMESFELQLVNIPVGASVVYNAHVQNKGWMPEVSDNLMAGTSGEGLRMEALKIHLVNAPKLAIEYRVHIQNMGWGAWVKNGEMAGTEGMGLRLEAIEIRVVDDPNLAAFDAAIASVNEANVVTGLAAYQDVVAANALLDTDTQAIVDAKTAAIVAAQANLVGAGDLTLFNEILIEAVQPDFTPESWVAYAAVLNNPINKVRTINTQAEIDAATLAIGDAQAFLVSFAQLEAEKITAANLGVIHVGDSVIAKAQALTVGANVVVNRGDRIVISDAGGALSLGVGDVTFFVTKGTFTYRMQPLSIHVQ